MRIELPTPRTYMDALQPMQTEIIGESMTRQDQADIVNINTIFAKTQRGEIVLGSREQPTFGDFSDNGTYDVMLETIMAAESAFMDLPASERKKYNNDPAVYYEKTMSGAEALHTEKQKASAKEKEQKAFDEKLAKAQKLVKDNPKEE